jgi:hypothetical protein
MAMPCAVLQQSTISAWLDDFLLRTRPTRGDFMCKMQCKAPPAPQPTAALGPSIFPTLLTFAFGMFDMPLLRRILDR